MKNKNKLSAKWPVLLLVLVIGLSIIACDINNDGGYGGAGFPYDTPTGFYLGIVGFNDKVTLREARFLSSGNKYQFQTFIRNMELGHFVGLYYAVDKAIDHLLTAKLPDDLKSVSIITFTVGFDNDSSDINLNFTGTQEEYRLAIIERIADTKIKNLPINAFSIGIRGPEVDVSVPDAEFQSSLADLASAPANFHFFSGTNLAVNINVAERMPDVIDKFIAIAQNLYDDRTEGSHVIMLVLDTSAQLDQNSAGGSLAMRDAAINFVNTLLNGSGESTNAGTDINSAILLNAGQWTAGNLPVVTSVNYYKVNASVGIPYFFWWSDIDSPITTSPAIADIEVSFSSDGDNWSRWVDTAWVRNDGFNFPVHRNGTIYMRVRPFRTLPGSTGTYDITYRAFNNARPNFWPN